MNARTLRYLAPNLVTGANLVFGMLSVAASVEGRYVDAAWWICYAVLTDRIDGFVARRLKATSELGVQLDSFADMLNFGVAPAVLVYTALGSAPGLPFGGGWERAALIGGCAAWVLAAVFRLARYNVVAGQGPVDVFFGAPTTLCGGLLVVWFLTLVKYSPEGAPLYAGEVAGYKLLGGWETPEIAWQLFPVGLWLGAFLMVSTLRVRKLGMLPSRALTAFVLTNVAAGYILGFARLFPEYLIVPPTGWLLVYLAKGLSAEARTIKPPPIFPEESGPNRR
jgi:CDP-diacylglycerol--serine O-phosphatidyltransferase